MSFSWVNRANFTRAHPPRPNIFSICMIGLYTERERERENNNGCSIATGWSKARGEQYMLNHN